MNRFSFQAIAALLVEHILLLKQQWDFSKQNETQCYVLDTIQPRKLEENRRREVREQKGWRELHNEMLHNYYNPPHIIDVIK